MDLNRIKLIAKDIISDDEWVNDSHSQAEHTGIKDGLTRLIRHLEETKEESYWFHKADKIKKDGYWYAKISDIK
tara:strand:- start:574 stop:795 length:222 start_codon:yes stop_codon:yes gene_type:complete